MEATVYSRCKISIGGGGFTQEPFADDVSQDCLLGADFLATHDFTADLKSRTLSSGTIINPTHQASYQGTAVCRVYICESLVIRAGEERLFWAKSFFPLYIGVLEPKEGLQEQHGESGCSSHRQGGPYACSKPCSLSSDPL